MRERRAMQAASYRYVVFGIEYIRRFRAGYVVEFKRDYSRFVRGGIVFYAAYVFYFGYYFVGGKNEFFPERFHVVFDIVYALFKRGYRGQVKSSRFQPFRVPRRLVGAERFAARTAEYKRAYFRFLRVHERAEPDYSV